MLSSLPDVLSPPLAQIVRFMDRESDNFTAELLLKQIGAANGATGTTATGAALVRTTLAEAGIPLAGVRIVDGSGLSSLDRLTARAIVGFSRPPGKTRTIKASFVSRTGGVGSHRHAEGSAAEAPCARSRARQDRHDLARLGALRLRPGSLRLLGAAKRPACLVHVGEACPRPVCDRFSCSVASSSACSSRMGTPSCSALCRASSPAPRRRSHRWSSSSTESATFAPLASSALRASSRLKPSSVPVMT